MLHRCHPSVLIRWFLFLLLPFAGFAWAIGFSAINVTQRAQNQPPGSLLRLGAHSSTYSTNPIDAPSQLLPATSIFYKSKLRGWSIRTNGKEQQLKKNVNQPDNTTAAESLRIPGRFKQLSKRRKLNGCTDRDVSISQSRDMIGGVPQFIVQIYNTCFNNSCAPSDVHVNCGWFASKVVVNPIVFRRVAFDDCLVNAGKAILPGQILRFTYQNSFMYPLSFKSAQFC